MFEIAIFVLIIAVGVTIFLSGMAIGLVITHIIWSHFE